MLANAFNEKRRLLLWLTILLTAGFAITSMVSYFVSRNAIRHEIVTNELPLTTDNVYSEIQKDLIRIVFVSSMMAHDTFLRDWAMDGESDVGKIEKYLKEIQEKYDTITSFFISEQSLIYYNEGGILKKLSEHSPLDAWYFRARGISEPYELNIDPAEAHDNALTIFINHHVTDYSGNFIGIVGVGQTVDSLRKLIDRYQSRYQRTVYLTDMQGRVVLHGSEFPLAAEDIHTVPGLGELADTLLGGADGTYQYERDGRTYQLNTRFVAELGWYLLVEKSESKAVEVILDTLFLNLAICALITFVVVLLARLSINRHQGRLRRVVETHTAQLNEALNETRAANQAKKQMLAYISHDLRTPLTSIVHYARLLGTERGENAEQYSAIIEKNVLNQMEMIDDLTEYARGDLDQLKVSPAPTYVHSLLGDMAEQGELMAARRNNRFEMVVDEHVPPVAVFDPYRLKQVLGNLLSNAAKFTTGGDIRLRVEVIPGAAPEGHARLRFEVSDTGTGIPQSEQPHIFQPYARGESTAPGYGLGLAIARQVVRRMGGDLELESTSSKGSRFWFEIPLETAAEDAVLQPAHAFPMPELFGTGKRVLVINADPTMRDYLSEILALADFDVEHMAGISEGLRAMAEGIFHVVLITGSMPQQNAWDFLARVRAMRLAHPPQVILCSGVPLRRPDGIPDDLVFSAFMLKPVNAAGLLKTLQELSWA